MRHISIKEKEERKILSQFDSNPAVAKSQLIEEIDRLHFCSIKPEPKIRKNEVERLIEMFISATGTRPDPRSLKRLGDYLLIKDRTNSNQLLEYLPNKQAI